MLNMYGVRIEESLEQQQYNASWRQQYEKEQERARGIAIERIRTGTATQSQIDQIQRDSSSGGALDPNRLNAERAAAIQQAEFEAKNAKRAQEQAAAAAAAEERRLYAERNMSYNDRQKAAADAASAAATAAVTASVQAAGAVPAARAATNSTNPQTPKETGAKVDAALKKHKADVAKAKKSVSKLKEKAKNKKSFAKGIAKMKKNRGR